MAKSIAFLPSLLDRISDDQPLRQRLDQLQNQIKKKQALQQQSQGEQKEQLQAELDQLKQQYAIISANAATSLQEIKECVKRDLNWLLNAQYYAPQSDLEAYPEVQSSVINYGLPDLAGLTASSIDHSELAAAIKQAILRFEPRLLPHSLKVRFIEDRRAMSHNTLTFEIESELWSEPVPIYLRLRTELELESGNANLSDQ